MRVFQKYFDANELWAGKNLFSTYVCYTPDGGGRERFILTECVLISCLTFFV